MEESKKINLELKHPDLLTNDQIAALLKIIPELEDWAKQVTSHAVKKALEGEKFAGYKLVAGKSVRAWKSEKEVAEALELEGFAEEDIFTKKLIGIGAAEKLVGKKNFDIILGDYIKINKGNPALVADTDPRPAYDPNVEAKNDFED